MLYISYGIANVFFFLLGLFVESFKWRKPEIASTFLPIPRQHHTLIAVPSVTQPGELSPSLVFLFGGEASGQDNFLEFNQLINLTIGK